MRIRQNIVMQKFRRFPGRVMFPSTHDIVDVPEAKEACFDTIRGLLNSNNEVLITTKPAASIIREIDRLFSAFKSKIQFRFTITSRDDRLLRFWEPNAPLFEERMESLKYASRKKYKTSVSIEPFLDMEPEVLVAAVAPYCTESIWLGKMNYIACHPHDLANTKQYYEAVRSNYTVERLASIFERLSPISKIRFKDSIIFRLQRHGYFDEEDRQRRVYRE